MNYWEHFSCIDDTIYFKVRGIEIFALVNGLLVVISLGEPLVMGLVETINFVLHIFS